MRRATEQKRRWLRRWPRLWQLERWTLLLIAALFAVGAVVIGVSTFAAVYSTSQRVHIAATDLSAAAAFAEAMSAKATSPTQLEDVDRRLAIAAAKLDAVQSVQNANGVALSWLIGALSFMVAIGALVVSLFGAAPQKTALNASDGESMSAPTVPAVTRAD